MQSRIRNTEFDIGGESQMRLRGNIDCIDDDGERVKGA
eukprot:COSAG02_NODE_6417_length_3586_cov_1.850014_1_plen_38_part_00